MVLLSYDISLTSLMQKSLPLIAVRPTLLYLWLQKKISPNSVDIFIQTLFDRQYQNVNNDETNIFHFYKSQNKFIDPTLHS